MSFPSVSNDHNRRDFMAMASADLRNLDAATVCSLWARRLLETGDLTAKEKQNLRDICRQHRQVATNRSSFATLLELSPRAADVSDAVYGLTLTRVGILGRSDYRLPCPEHAHVVEESANHTGNLAQLEHKQRRSRTTLEALVYSMGKQATASEQLADSEIGAFRSR